jgi:hypothetical protein
MALDYYFFHIVGLHLVLNIFLFPVSIGKLKFKIFNIRRSAAEAFRALLILPCPLFRASTIGAVILIPLIGETRQIKIDLRIFLIGAANAPRFNYGCAALHL